MNPTLDIGGVANVVTIDGEPSVRIGIDQGLGFVVLSVVREGKPAGRLRLPLARARSVAAGLLIAATSLEKATR